MRGRFLLLAVAALLTFGMGAARATLYMVVGDQNAAFTALTSVNTSTGLATLVGPNGLSGAITPSLAIDQSGQAFTEIGGGSGNPGGQLGQYNLATGAVTPIGPVTNGAILSMAVAPDNTLYGLSIANGVVDNPLFTIDKTTGALTQIGLTPATYDAAFDPAGNLYGALAPFGAPLFQIDPVTGNPSLLGPLYDAANPSTTLSAQSLAFDPSGNLYATLLGPGPDYYLGTVDLHTGATHLIGDTGIAITNDFTLGMDFTPAAVTTSVPEPMTAGLSTLGLAAVVLLAAGRRPRKAPSRVYSW